VVPEGAAGGGEGGIVGRNASAFSRCDLLVRVKAEGGSISPSADWTVANLSAECLTPIVNEMEIVLVAECPEGGPVCRLPKDVHG
jgi:hypothetical protein